MPLSQIAPLQRGFDLPTDKVFYGEFPVVYSNGILRNHNEYKCVAPGVITGRSGTIGKFTFISSGFYWPHNTSLWVTDFCDNYPLFIYYLYQSINVEQFSTGSGVPTLNRNDVHRYKTSIPDYEEQEKIAKFLQLLDERIATQRRLIDKLETLIKGIVVSHFNNCNTKETISIKDLGEAYSVGNLSKDDLSESGKPCIIYGELFTTYGCVAREIQSRTSKYNQATLSRAGDLLFPASTTVDAISLIAPTSLQADGVYVAGDMFGIHILPKFNSEYISYLLNYVYNRTLSKYAQGSTIIHLHYADIKNTTIQVPCLEEQNKCAELMEALQIKLDVAKQLIDCYQLQKSNLLQRMFI